MPPKGEGTIMGFPFLLFTSLLLTDLPLYRGSARMCIYNFSLMTNFPLADPTQFPNPPSRILTQEDFLDEWIIQFITIDPKVTTFLSGEESLFQAYLHACENERETPLPLRIFTKRLEFNLEFHFRKKKAKKRGQRGMFFPGIKLKTSTT